MADLIVAVFGAVISLLALSQAGSPLIWGWIGLFAVFGVWQAYVLSRQPTT